MSSRALEGLLFVAGFFLIFIFCTESCQQGLGRLKAFLQQRPRLKYLVYPRGRLAVPRRRSLSGQFPGEFCGQPLLL